MKLCVGLLAAVLGAGCGGEELSDEDCELASGSNVEAVVLVHPERDERVEDYEVHPFFLGVQVQRMLWLRIRLLGRELPDCIATTTELVQCYDRECSEVAAEPYWMRSYKMKTLEIETLEDGMSQRTSDKNTIIFGGDARGELLRFTATVGSKEFAKTTSRLLWLGDKGLVPRTATRGADAR